MPNKVSILIVEDETLLSQDISIRLVGMGYQVAGIASSVDDAIVILNREIVDIVMIDIMLKGDKDGIVLGQFIKDHHKIPFIFLTAHSDTALVDRAKKVKPCAYMLKPFNDNSIRVSIDMALANFEREQSDDEIIAEEASNKKINFAQVKDSLFLKKTDFFQRVNLKDILWLEAESNYTVFHTLSEKFTYSTVLKKIEKKLPEFQFLRVHRSYIVNIQSVTGFVGNTLYINKKMIPVSKPHHNEVFNCFNAI